MDRFIISRVEWSGVGRKGDEMRGKQGKAQQSRDEWSGEKRVE